MKRWHRIDKATGEISHASLPQVVAVVRQYLEVHSAFANNWIEEVEKTSGKFCIATARYEFAEDLLAPVERPKFIPAARRLYVGLARHAGKLLDLSDATAIPYNSLNEFSEHKRELEPIYIKALEAHMETHPFS